MYSKIAPFMISLNNVKLKVKSTNILHANVEIWCVSFSCWSLYFTGVVAQQSEIWFLDRSLCWHFLTATFTSYYRLMITHLGLPEWQYAFTPYGPSPQAKVAKSLISHCKTMHCVLNGILQLLCCVPAVTRSF